MTTDAVGGVWTYALELVTGLAGRSVDVVLVVTGPRPTAEQLTQLAATPVAEVLVLDAPLEWMDDPWERLDATGHRLLDVAARVAPDVVHLNGYCQATLPWPAPVVVVAHSDVLSWHRSVHREPAPPRWSTYATRVAAGLDVADAVVAPTAAVLDDLRREYGFTGGMVIPNGRTNDWVIEQPKELLVVAAGRLGDPAKNVGALEQAAGALDWPVVLLGADAPPGGPLPNAHRLGPVAFPTVASWLGKAAVFAAPARYEPFGLAPLEAALSRCALVLGDVPSLREVWGDAAIFVDPCDPDALGRALSTLSRDAFARTEWAARAHSRALDFGVDRMAQAYADLYRSLIPVAVAPCGS